MIYRKNIYAWEQIARIGLGVAMVVYALVAQRFTLFGYALDATGIFTAITGFVGWCPLCAVGGRKLKSES